MSRSTVMDRFLRMVATFALLGPLVGVGVIWIGLIGVATFTADDAWHGSEQLLDYVLGVPVAVMVSVAIGYLFGIFPAAATGIVCHFFARSIRSNAFWILACALMGSAVSAVALVVMWGVGGLLDYYSLVLFVAPGAAAGAVCAWKLRRSRWA